jgi:hypothetical protein
MSIDLNTLRAMSLSRLVAYLAVVGGLAGLFAWMLVFGGHIVFEISRPTWTSLLLAIPRGSLFAIVLGLVLRWYWSRRRGQAASEREF